MSANNEAAVLIGAGKVQYVAGAPTFTWQNGAFTNAIADTGAGDCLITIDPDYLVAIADRIIKVSPLSVGAAGNVNIQYVETAVNQIQVLGFVVAVATDEGFGIWMWQRKFN